MYSDHVPNFLRDRPRFFVSHCMEKIHFASGFSQKDVKDVGRRQVEVKSSSTVLGRANHIVNFNAPHCDCDNWKQTYLPCKHMFAAIRYISGYSWYDLPERYRNSPYFTLDRMFILQHDNSAKAVEDHTEAISDDKASAEIATLQITATDISREACLTTTNDEPPTKVKETEEETVNSQLPINNLLIKNFDVSKQRNRNTLAAECRDLLDQIRNLTFLVRNKSTLTDLQEDLLHTVKTLKSNADRDNGFILEEISKARMLHVRQNGKKKSKSKNNANQDDKQGIGIDSTAVTQTKKLPPDTSKKDRKRRFGAAYEWKETHNNVMLDINTGLPGETDIHSILQTLSSLTWQNS